jgi:hypothetical protein
MQPTAADEATTFAAALRATAAPLSFRHTRWVFLRALGFIYVIAFAILCEQGPALLGSQGLLPAAGYVERIKRSIGFAEHPTLFWFAASDQVLRSAAWLGLVLGLLMFLGVDHALLSALLWLLYISFVHVGQIFYGYGWETLLLESGFLAIFLGTLRNWTSLRDTRPMPRIMFVWLCWLLFRLMSASAATRQPCRATTHACCVSSRATGSAPLREISSSRPRTDTAIRSR